MMDRWDTHFAAWKAARAAALAGGTCFCAHGCAAPATHTQWFLGIKVPGLCDGCFDLSRLKASKKVHFLPKQATDTYVEDAPVKREPSGIHRIVRRVLGTDERSTAERYVREYGPNGLRVVSDLYDKVAAGEHLTDAEAEAVLRSEVAEVRSSEVALKRIMATERKAAKRMDLNKVFLDVEDGDYAVIGDDDEVVILRVKREVEGGFRGFLIVNCVVGEGVQKWGVVYPQPARWTNPDHRQFYRGYMAHLVAMLARNPAAARALYLRVMEERVAA